MEFITLMNPPYDRNLHLKFLEKSITFSKNVVSLQPTRWLTCPVQKYKKHTNYKKYECSISKHIYDLDIYNSVRAYDDFGIYVSDIGIFCCNSFGDFDYDFSDTVVDKVIAKIDKSYKCKIKQTVPSTCVVPSMVLGTDAVNVDKRFDFVGRVFNPIPEKNIYVDGINQYYGITYYEYKKKTSWGKSIYNKDSKEGNCISFKTKQECLNFIYSTNSKLYRYVLHRATVGFFAAFEYLPFLEDYSHPYTDEMLYEMFNITEEEQNRIDKYISQYNEHHKRKPLEI